MALDNSEIGAGTAFGDNRPTPELIERYTSGDTRKAVNIDTLQNGNPFAKKYIEMLQLEFDGDKNFIVFRLADVLLMYAEVLNELNEQGQAITYLNQVRKRASPGKTDYTASQFSTKEALSDSIALERQLELAFENHRWFDLLRTDKALEVMNAQTLLNGAKGASVPITPGKLLFPIPQSQIDDSAGVITQNKT